MTTQGNWSPDTPQHGYQPGGTTGSGQWSAAAESQTAMPGASPPAGDPSRIESLLHSLVTRLEENDRRYDAALSNLENRLNEISSRAGTADSGGTGAAAEALNRVGRQAESLAQEVRSAEPEQGSGHNDDTLRAIEDRIGEFAASLQKGEPALTPETALDARDPAHLQPDTFSQKFASATAGFEQSLAAGQPTAPLEELNSRMSELAHRFDSALNNRSDAGALSAIEAQLNNLSAKFAQAQKQYGRVEAIEKSLVQMMDWARSQESRIETAAKKAAQETVRCSGEDTTGVSTRLDAVQQELEALSERSREIDGRTVDTLQSMNSALQFLTRKATDKNNVKPSSAKPAPHPDPEPAQQAAAGEPAPVQPDTRLNEVGASIPDYQEMQPAQSHQDRQDDGPIPDATTSYRPGSEQPVLDDDDFLASARRAAEAAAYQPGEPAKDKSLFSGFRRGGAARLPAAPGVRLSRPVLMAATIILLVISAALLFGQLKNRTSSPVAVTPGATTPAVPSPKPSRFDSRVPEAAVRKDTNRLPGEPLHGDRSAVTHAPLATEQPDTQKPKREVQAPATTQTQRPRNMPAAPGQQTRRQPADTSQAKLASLPQLPVDPRYPGVSVTIAEPDRPASRKKTMAPLVPASPTIPIEPAPKAPAKPRIEASQRPPAKAQPRPESTNPRSPMPPAAIGPQSLRLAAANGNREAQFEVASRYAAGNGVTRDFTRASQWYARAAAQGLAPAQYRLATLYERGRGVKKDPALARVWYERAAIQGNVKAMHNLAVMYTGGQGRKPDHDNAAKWFAQAARYGLADSQFNLGILYETGLGVKKNLLQAYQWFSLAAARGDNEAKKRKQSLRLKLRSDRIQTAERTVRLWRVRPVVKAANQVRPPKGGWRAVTKGGHGTADNALVSRAQTLLNKLGYDAGVPDGVLGPQTVAAIRRFESKNGKAVTGGVTPGLIAQLKALAG